MNILIIIHFGNFESFDSFAFEQKMSPCSVPRMLLSVRKTEMNQSPRFAKLMVWLGRQVDQKKKKVQRNMKEIINVFRG